MRVCILQQKVANCSWPLAVSNGQNQIPWNPSTVKNFSADFATIKKSFDVSFLPDSLFQSNSFVDNHSSIKTSFWQNQKVLFEIKTPSGNLDSHRDVSEQNDLFCFHLKNTTEQLSERETDLCWIQSDSQSFGVLRLKQQQAAENRPQ